MLVVAEAELALGQELDFALQLPGVSGMVSGRGRIVRLTKRFEYGLEFTDLQGDVLDRLREFLHAPRPGEASP